MVLQGRLQPGPRHAAGHCTSPVAHGTWALSVVRLRHTASSDLAYTPHQCEHQGTALLCTRELPERLSMGPLQKRRLFRMQRTLREKPRSVFKLLRPRRPEEGLPHATAVGALGPQWRSSWLPGGPPGQ